LGTPELTGPLTVSPTDPRSPQNLGFVDVLGVSCAVGTPRTAAQVAIDRARSGDGGYGVFCNVHLLMTAKREDTVKEALNDAWHVFPDGAPLAWMQRRDGNLDAARIGGPDFMLEVLDLGREGGMRHLLFGSTGEVIMPLRERLERRFPGVLIVDAYAPPRGVENSDECFERLRAADADVIWCALGAPKQELWMRRASPRLGSALLFGVGAAFDFHSGTKARAPAWVRRAGFEWLHRLLSEPRRLLGRYVVTNSQFAFHVTRALFTERRSRRGTGT
jgi:N-acetylglucosaminyldiphosphoundecaprenol N-acetyl-beta-D-mannosaminyltransferase